MSRLKPRKAAAIPQASARYVNREFSWLQFNERVLDEAANRSNPLLERLKFLAIFESNLDEFYMVRVSGLIELEDSGVSELSPDGLSPREQISLIHRTSEPLRTRANEIWKNDLVPRMSEQGIALLGYRDLSPKQQERMREFFQREVFPVCTPLILHPAPSVPFISNRSLNLAVALADDGGGFRLGRVKVPTSFPRAIRVSKRRHEYVLLEEIVEANLALLFPGVRIVGAHAFRVIRDADIEIRELEAGDLIETVEQTIRLRRFGDPVLLEADASMPAEHRGLLMKLLDLDSSCVLRVGGLIGFDVLWELSKIDRPGLRFPVHHPHLAEPLSGVPRVFDTVSERDVLVHHPFDSFRTIEDFVASAASDPAVIGIKQTLYRVGSESPIVESLLDAAEAGKQVAVMVELKARFDESNNLVWARALERAGAHVTYGFPELKTHCKLCLVVRRESGGIRSYAHIGTGNYNPSTSRIYTDFGLLSCDFDITQDISELFNFLTGFSKQTEYRKLLVSPNGIRSGVLSRIGREIDCARKTGRGRLLFKVNSIVDPEIIDALYEASCAGVDVDLIVRGICCLRPGVPGTSDRIRVVSIVGRFLEHSRALYFENGGSPEVFLGSADLMRRNLDRRVEVLVPLLDPRLVHQLLNGVLEHYFADNSNSWRLLQGGIYERSKRFKGKKAFEAQRYLMDHALTKLEFE